jgi:hypothetical protein
MGYFDLKTLGAAAIKGLETPLPVYEVVGVGRLRTERGKRLGTIRTEHR